MSNQLCHFPLLLTVLVFLSILVNECGVLSFNIILFFILLPNQYHYHLCILSELQVQKS